VDELKDLKALREVANKERELAWRTYIQTLAALCEAFSACLAAECFLPPEGERRSWESLVDKAKPTLICMLPLFEEADTSADGTCAGRISPVDVYELGHRLGFELDWPAIASFFEQAPACPIEGMRFSEFSSLVLNVRGAQGQGAALAVKYSHRVFGFFDVDGGGSIDQQEMIDRLAKPLGFDYAAVDQLYLDICGVPRRTLTYAECKRYFERLADENEH